MPIDENVLNATIIQVREEEQRIQVKTSRVRNIRSCLEQIKIQQIRVQNESGGYDVVDQQPRDTQMNEVMTDTRRELIYNQNISLWDEYQT